MLGNASANPSIELWQFRLSMYPEKVRWALDYKGVPHIRHSLLPGPHVMPMLGGVPVRRRYRCSDTARTLVKLVQLRLSTIWSGGFRSRLFTRPIRS